MTALGSSGVVDADAEVVAGGRPPSARTPLNRDRVVAAALTHIEESGLSGLTMRRLGERLGVEAMALYRYVPGKEELLDAVVDSILGQIDSDEEVFREPVAGWQDFLQRLAHGLRRVALAHPKAFPLVVSRPPEAPWLRPPLRNLQWVEMLIDALQEQGFNDESAVATYRAFSTFLLGHLLLEVATLGADVGPLDALDGDPDGDGDLSDYPSLQRLSDKLSQDRSAQEFEIALEDLLDRLSLLIKEQDEPSDD